MRRIFLACAVISIVSCGGGDGGGTPTSPNPTPTQTRVMVIDGALDFGDVKVGQSFDRSFRIHNTGNSPMTVESLTIPNASVFAANFTNGTIQPSSVQVINVRFTPTARQDYSGTLTVRANHTSGSNTISVTARGDRDLFTRTGSGNSVFDMPRESMRVRIFGRWDGRSTSNFIVRVGGSLVVNAILRDRNPYEGVHLVSGGTVEIVQSEGITEWRITEER